MGFCGRCGSLSDAHRGPVRFTFSDEKPSYGLFYAYWMAKFYGYALTEDGYVRNRKEKDWSETLRSSVRINYYIEQSKKLEKDKASWVDSLEVFKARDRSVQELWAITLKHLNKIRTGI